MLFLQTLEGGVDLQDLVEEGARLPGPPVPAPGSTPD